MARPMHSLPIQHFLTILPLPLCDSMGSLPRAAASAGYAVTYTGPDCVEASGMAKGLSHPLNQCVVLSTTLSLGAGLAIICRNGKVPLVMVHESVYWKEYATSSTSLGSSLSRPSMESVVDYDTNVGVQGAGIHQ